CCLVLSSQVRQRIDRGMSLRLGIAQRLQLISSTPISFSRILNYLINIFKSVGFISLSIERVLLVLGQVRQTIDNPMSIRNRIILFLVLSHRTIMVLLYAVLQLLGKYDASVRRLSDASVDFSLGVTSIHAVIN